jgi:hypothetical protein
MRNTYLQSQAGHILAWSKICFHCNGQERIFFWGFPPRLLLNWLSLFLMQLSLRSQSFLVVCSRAWFSSFFFAFVRDESAE